MHPPTVGMSEARPTVGLSDARTTFDGSEPPEGAPEAATAGATFAVFGARLGLGHCVAYGPTLIAAFGGFPAVLWWRSEAIRDADASTPVAPLVAEAVAPLVLEPLEVVQVQLVLEGVLVVCVIVALVVHAAALVWALDAAHAARLPPAERARRRTGYRVFTWTTGVTTGFTAVASALGWWWLLTL